MTVTDKKKTQATLKIPVGGRILEIAAKQDFLPRDSCIFERSAAQISCALSMAAGDRELLESDLRSLGYSDTVFFDNSSRDSAGLCIASRVKGNRLEAAVTVRGTVGNEWYSNFDIGYTAEHSGFAKAADSAELRIGDYIFTHAIGLEPVFYITGYSRGGAVAGILAKRLSERYGTNSVWAYTFASPRVTISRRTTGYNCIFNIIRNEDLFTRLPPEGWGYSRYGRDIPLTAPDDFAERFRSISGEEYIGFTDTSAIDSFIRSVMQLAPNVHAYYERRRQAGSRKLSLYGFMTAVADMLSSDADENTADTLMAAMISDYAGLVDFLSDGAELSDLLSSAQAIPRCSVADSHSPTAYIASLR